MELDLFLGCVIAARLPFLESSGRKMFSKLGIELNNVEDFSCCPDPTGLEVVSKKSVDCIRSQKSKHVKSEGWDRFFLCWVR